MGVVFSVVVVNGGSVVFESSLGVCVVRVIGDSSSSSSVVISGGGQSVVVVSVVGGASVVVGVSVVVVGVRGRSQALRQSSSESKMLGPLIGQKTTLGKQDREARS